MGNNGAANGPAGAGFSGTKNPFVVALVVGTRPEVIKLAPVLWAIERRPEFGHAKIVSTSQQRDLVAQALSDLKIKPTMQLTLDEGQRGDLGTQLGAMLGGFKEVLAALSPSLIVVQGDTSSAFAGAVAGFYAGIPVAHVEAGLRTTRVTSPFPEEMHRRLIAGLTTLHFAPTKVAAANLLREGVAPNRVAVVGNPVVDALLNTPTVDEWRIGRDHEEQLLVITVHRRESWGGILREIAASIRDAIERHPKLHVVWPLHANPAVQTVIRQQLRDPRIHLYGPLPYTRFLSLMRAATLILTDSGGVQEEAHTLGIPALVVRDETERVEAIGVGLTIIGRERKEILTALNAALTAPSYPRARSVTNVFGDGRAGDRIIQAISRWWNGLEPLLTAAEEFGGSEFAAPPCNEV
jgi:UDP-N-acetylglucosamine 2-epimerase (non-hydrolysing)